MRGPQKSGGLAWVARVARRSSCRFAASSGRTPASAVLGFGTSALTTVPMPPDPAPGRQVGRWGSVLLAQIQTEKVHSPAVVPVSQEVPSLHFCLMAHSWKN